MPSHDLAHDLDAAVGENGRTRVGENWWYRLLEVRQGADTFYVINDDGPRPQQLAGPTAHTLTEYLQTLGAYGWEVCGTLVGEHGHNTIILKQRV